MCLSRMDKKKKDWRVGYKVFDNEPGWYYSPYKYSPMRKGRWYTDANDWPIYISSNRKYDPGYHFYRDLKDAKKMVDLSVQCIMKIRARKITATGAEYGKRVGVAREIYLEEVVT